MTDPAGGRPPAGQPTAPMMHCPLKRLKHYELVSPIGKGGMGEVYLAQDEELERQVAIKFLPEALHPDPKARERFLREDKAAAALDHPFICKVFEAGEFEGRSYIVMEFVEGKSLRDRIAEGPFPLADALRATLEVAEALEVAHAKGIVHRDLKPANLMCTPQGHIKVMDFGSAKHIIAEPAEASAVNFTRTMTAGPAPGVHHEPRCCLGNDRLHVAGAGEGGVGRRPDRMFSLGVVLTEMISGKHPFEKPTPVETLTSVLRDNPPPVHVKPKVLDPDLARILNRAMAKDTSARYPKIGEMAADIRSLLADIEPHGGGLRGWRPRSWR